MKEYIAGENLYGKPTVFSKPNHEQSRFLGGHTKYDDYLTLDTMEDAEKVCCYLNHKLEERVEEKMREIMKRNEITDKRFEDLDYCNSIKDNETGEVYNEYDFITGKVTDLLNQLCAVEIKSFNDKEVSRKEG